MKTETPKPWYNPHGDCIIYQIRDEAIVAERIDEILTIYRSIENNSPVGYQIKGVKALIERFGWSGLLVESANDANELKAISLSALLLSAYETGPKTISRRLGYADAFDSCERTPRVSAEELEMAFAK